MKNENKLITYSVSLTFDTQVEDILLSLRHKISLLTDNTYSDSLNIPPHITLGMFRACDEENDKLHFIKELQPFFSFIHKKKINLTLDKFGTFRNKDIFAKFNSNDFPLLKELNLQLHKCVQNKYKPCCNNLYIVKNFYPHVSIITGLSNKEIKIGLEAIDNEKELICPIKKLIVAVRRPYCVFYEEKL